MRIATLTIAALWFSLAVTGCAEPGGHEAAGGVGPADVAPVPTNGAPAPADVAPAPADGASPYAFVSTKTEEFGHHNVMDLYALRGSLDVQALKALCRERLAQSSSSVFHFVVVFDDPANAVYPTTPFTAQYDTDERASRHIRAICAFNRVNGFAELTYYDRNKWESLANSEAL